MANQRSGGKPNQDKAKAEEYPGEIYYERQNTGNINDGYQEEEQHE
jgi:hypothetical protein